MKRTLTFAACVLALCLAASEARAIQIGLPGLWVDVPLVIGCDPVYPAPPAVVPVMYPCAPPPPPPPPGAWRGGGWGGGWGYGPGPWNRGGYPPPGYRGPGNPGWYGPPPPPPGRPMPRRYGRGW